MISVFSPIRFNLATPSKNMLSNLHYLQENNVYTWWIRSCAWFICGGDNAYTWGNQYYTWFIHKGDKVIYMIGIHRMSIDGWDDKKRKLIAKWIYGYVAFFLLCRIFIQPPSQRQGKI
jgi:hypothetical protein